MKTLISILHWTPIGWYTVPKFTKFEYSLNWYMLNGAVLGIEGGIIIVYLLNEITK